ncbi:MAG: hypothetical protein AUK44_02005 [Porphyromonadaceae bacterium CG2_30_38_12]|nr:MAG: hypothetical protein AUK44_02005 [Porphyromonadaceae bacterium CG2_30_38_12]
MNPNAICPISSSKIDENVARFNGALTVILLTVYVLTNNIVPIAFLLIDFILRGAQLAKYSILASVSKFIIDKFHITKKPINSGPKIFAARIGVIFASIILVASILNLQTVAFIFTAIFGLCALLEASINFCVACQVYPFVYKLTYRTASQKSL